MCVYPHAVCDVLHFRVRLRCDGCICRTIILFTVLFEKDSRERCVCARQRCVRVYVCLCVRDRTRAMGVSASKFTFLNLLYFTIEECEIMSALL